MPAELNLRQAEARAYNRARRRIEMASTAASLACLGAVVASAGGIGGWWALAALGLGLPAVELPFAVAGHRLSRRYGLSRQGPRSWLLDRAKALAVGLVLGGAVAAGLLLLQRAAGGWWPLLAWLGAVALSALLAALFPVVLLPLFLRSEALPEGPLADALARTAAAAGVPVRELRLLRMGEKTSAANALVAGLGPTVRIYVSDTLAETEDGETGEAALARARVVLAHELGHHRSRDVWRLVAVSAVSAGAGVLGAWAGVALAAPDGRGHLTTLPAAALGFSLASAAAGPIVGAYARRRERAADRFAIGVTGEGETLAVALERLVARNLAEIDPPRLYHVLTASHPTPRERIAAARAAAMSGSVQD